MTWTNALQNRCDMYIHVQWTGVLYCNMLAVNARTSMGSLYSSMRGMDIPIDIKLNLCDAYVSPILCYSSEIWGLCDAEVIERVHRCYIKRILNVKRTTTSNAIYGETGRFPLIINRKYVW